MKFSRILAIAAIACAAVVSAVSDGFYRLMAAWAEPFQPQAKALGQEKPRLALVAARAFVGRVLKRRPSVHPSWRMSPSI